MARRPRLSYRQQQTLSLFVLAIVPVLLGAIVVLGQVDAAIRVETNDRAASAARAVQTVLGDDAASLDALAASYAGWATLKDDIAALRQQAIADTVVDFQVSQGGADVAVVVAGTNVVSAGSPADSAALAQMLRTRLAQPGALPSQGAYADLPDGVYHVSLQAIDLTGRTGAGVTASDGRAGLAFATRLGSAFVVRARQLTDFDVAVYDRQGTLSAASDQAVALLAGPVVAEGATGLQRLPASVVAVGIPIMSSPAGPSGGTTGGGTSAGSGSGTSGAAPVRVGTLVVATQLGLTTTIGTSLVPYLAVLLALVFVFAASLAVYLADLLRRRLGVVESGIGAVAAGDLSIRLPEGDRDAIDRLAASHNRLAAALEARDRVIWRSLEALEALRPERGASAVLADVLVAARSIFDLDTCRLVDASGSVVASDPVEAAGGGADSDVSASQVEERVARDHVAAGGVAEGTGANRADGRAGQADAARTTALAEVDALAGSRLEGTGRAVASWTRADHAVFGLFARESGVALRSAGLHEAAARRAQRLGQANELQRQFVRGLGHNLQAPLARILMSSEDLASDGLADEPRRLASEINADASRLSRVVGELMTATRLDAGVFVPEAEPFALVPAVTRAWHAIASDRELDLVDGSAGWLAMGDRDAVEQVLWILLDNAVRYAPGGPIHVAIRPEGGAIEVRVRDEGPGIPRSERALVFRRFQRGSTARGHDGTGLGLDVARRLLRAMGGRIRYEDDGGGATFVITLPAERVGAPE